MSSQHPPSHLARLPNIRYSSKWAILTLDAGGSARFGQSVDQCYGAPALSLIAEPGSCAVIDSRTGLLDPDLTFRGCRSLAEIGSDLPQTLGPVHPAWRQHFVPNGEGLGQAKHSQFVCSRRRTAYDQISSHIFRPMLSTRSGTNRLREALCTRWPLFLHHHIHTTPMDTMDTKCTSLVPLSRSPYTVVRQLGLA
ncbi:hypothetical protein BR93DRAFT_302647 [Coniochaeta sp. PMI_546]|nr:hypothetical protein BR93DRAFT_302647 [Coniochaeta sp. PMI_546]